MKKLPLIISLLLTAYCNAQYTCGTDEQHAWLLKNDPEYLRQVQNRKPSSHKDLRGGTVPDTIPIVVHVIYLVNNFGTFGEMADSSVSKIIDYLNYTFNSPTADGVNIGLYFKLAQTDPDCRPTNGIIHIDASGDMEYALYGVHAGNMSRGISQADLAAKSYWDNTKYMNIWIVQKFSDPGIGGYAYYPTGFPTVYDGVVLNYNASYNAITHEMGHAFNLIHTFGGANGTTCPLDTDCTKDGDMICDIPPVLQNTDCDPLAINPCTNAAYGGNAVFNYMSYNACRHLFTPMQKDRMLDALYTYRSSLLASNTEWLPPQAPVVSIVSSDEDNIIGKNQLVTFTPTVSGSAAVKYHWLKNKVEVSTNKIYSTDRLAHGDEIVCVVEATDLACHVPVKAYSNKIKISTDQKHFVSIYPNPVYDNVTAWTPSENIKISTIRLFAANGKLLETKTVTPSSTVQYSLAGKSTGIYFLEFVSNKGTDVIKVMKEWVKF